ncbi:MAG: glycosyltransferase family 2 protein [Pseudomonadota bacterium]|jgi:N-acetylglucosaminyl-diphospho-decaprenol L-rhamnosyltransferase
MSQEPNVQLPIGQLPVTIVVVAYNSGDYLQACVDSLAVQTFPDFEVIIADNASEDDSIDRLRLPDSRFRVQYMGANLGFAAANNRVALRSRAAYIALLNPDAVAQPQWLAALVKAMRINPGAASVGGVQRRLLTPEVLDGAGDVWHVAGVVWRGLEGRAPTIPPGDGEIFGACGASALFRRQTFCDLGGFDERFFCYLEDVDLAFRLRLAGHSSIRTSGAVIDHAGSGITERHSTFSVYHGHRNRIWTFLKNTPEEIFWWALPYHLAFNAYYLFRAWRRGFLPPMLRAYRAAWEGRGPFLEERRRNRPRFGPTLGLRHMAISPWSPWFRELRPKR